GTILLLMSIGFFAGVDPAQSLGGKGGRVGAKLVEVGSGGSDREKSSKKRFGKCTFLSFGTRFLPFGTARPFRAKKPRFHGAFLPFYIKYYLLLCGKDLDRSSSEFASLGAARDPNVDLFAFYSTACVGDRIYPAPRAGF